MTKQFAKSLGDEGKELMKELDKMSVSGNQQGSYIKGSNISASQFIDSHIDAKGSITSLRKMYEGLPDPNTMSSFESQEEFVEKMMPYALKAVEGLGFNPLVLVAQAALETGWGQHVSAGNNYYGIKANSSWTGESEKLASPEFENGKFVSEVSSFRKYSDVLDSMKDYLKFIKENPRYEKQSAKVTLLMSILRKFKELDTLPIPTMQTNLKNFTQNCIYGIQIAYGYIEEEKGN